jgi:hypothetical protein
MICYCMDSLKVAEVSQGYLKLLFKSRKASEDKSFSAES